MARKRDLPTAAELGVDDVHDVLTGLLSLDGEIHRSEFKILCPNPEHPETNPSVDVNLETGWWHCFSCKAGGDIANLVRYVMGISYTAAKDLLRPGSPDAMVASVQHRITVMRRREADRDTAMKPDPANLHPPSRYSEGPYTYLRKRGFKMSTIERFGIRYVERAPIISPSSENGRFTVTHSIAIPIRDEKGKLLAWCYRATPKSKSWQPRYLYTPEFDTALHWYGIDQEPEGTVVITEGPLDRLWVEQCGFRALAMMGASTFNRTKARALERFDRVILFADYDAAGVMATRGLGDLIEGRVPASVCRYPKRAIRQMLREGKKKLDPQDLAPGDVKLVVGRATPWTAWKLRQRIGD